MITLYIPIWLVYVVLALILGPVVWFLFEFSVAWFGGLAAKYVLYRLTTWDSIKAYNLFAAQLRRDGKLPKRREFKFGNVTYSRQFQVAPKEEQEGGRDA